MMDLNGWLVFGTWFGCMAGCNIGMGIKGYFVVRKASKEGKKIGFL